MGCLFLGEVSRDLSDSQTHLPQSQGEGSLAVSEMSLERDNRLDVPCAKWIPVLPIGLIADHLLVPRRERLGFVPYRREAAAPDRGSISHFRSPP